MTLTDRRLALPLILLATAAYWCGVCGIRLNSDDYQYIASMAPIHSISDVFRPFVSHDANPSFFRPLANMTMAADFLFFGWSGAAFHITNLLFHLIATLVVFYFVRDIFRLTEGESLCAVLVFGLMASHEYNLVVDTARADVLVAIFVMLTLLLQQRAASSRQSQAGAYIAFACALCSKEIAIMALPLVMLFDLPNDRWDIRRRIRLMTPYVAVFLVFYFYHAHFTESILASQPLAAEGSHSIAALLRNGGYALGYTVLPLELETATTLLSQYRTVTIISGVILTAILIGLLFSNRAQFRLYVKPLLFALLTGSILLLTFERWRVYLPSIGIIAMGVLLVNHMGTVRLRSAALLLCLLLFIFHIYRGVAAQAEWHASTALRDLLKEDLTRTLGAISQRPVTLGILVSPSKLGGGTVIALGREALVQRAEADRLSERNRREGTLDGVQVIAWTAVEINALSAHEGFRGLSVEQIAPHRYLVSVPDSSHLQLYPTGEIRNNIERRDIAWREGDSLVTNEYADVVRRISAGVIKAIEIRVLDTTAIPLVFNGRLGFEPR